MWLAYNILCLFLLLGDENVQEIYDAIVMVREDQTGGGGGGGEGLMLKLRG